MALRRRAEPMHFFKLILSSTVEDKKLRLPEKFARIFGDELSTVATLTVPKGRVWQVGLIKDGRNIWIHDGWHEFVQYHSISNGYFLMFQYGKKSNFNVIIFDKTACEIQYPGGKEPDNDKPNSLGQDEIKNEEPVEIPDFAAPNPTLNPAKPSFVSADEDELMALLEVMGISVNNRFRNIAAEEKERAIAAARLFKPTNPSFMVILRSTETNCCRNLYVPAKFGRRYFGGNTKSIIKVLDSDGRKWPVQLTGTSQQFLTKLGGFAKKLDDGDICVFELIRRKILKVSILKKRVVVKEDGCKEKHDDDEATIDKSRAQKWSDAEEEEEDDDEATIEKIRAQKGSGGICGGSSKMSVVKVEGFEPRNPHFIANLRTATKKHLLLVPSKVLKQHKLSLPELVFFQNEHGKQWPGDVIRWKDGRTYIAGWKAFCRGNDVGVDDRCICEFLPGCNGKRDIIQVHIIRNAGSGS